MTPRTTQIDDEGGSKDEQWEYNIDSPISLDDIENDTVEEPKKGISKFIPFISFDREEKQISFSRRQR